MVIFLNKVTQEKEVFLKKINKTIFFSFFLLTFFVASNGWSINTKKTLQELVIKHVESIEEFSSQFLQTNGETIEEGNLYLGQYKKHKRMKIHYYSPSEIEIIIAQNKAMYFNKDLQELQYFNPKKSLASYFYNIFHSKTFFNEAIFKEKNNYIIVAKNLTVDEEKIILKIFIEKNPMVIRKLKIEKNDSVISFSIINHNFNPELNKKFFSMISPIK